MTRPLNSTLMDGCVKKVAYLSIIRQKLFDKMFKSLEDATQVYLSCLRDEGTDSLYAVCIIVIKENVNMTLVYYPI